MVQRGIIRWIALGTAMLTAIGVGLGAVGRTQAAEPATWVALGPTEKRVDRLYTPTSGALFAKMEDGFFRSADDGRTWATIAGPVEAPVLSVSSVDHDLMYAAGVGGVYRSQDGGTSWERMSAQGDRWSRIEASPADPSVVYAVALTSPPTNTGRNHWTEFRVSHDAGATWETIRTHHETFLGGTQPCAYAVRLLQPHSISTVRVLTIEGCTGRAMDPIGGMSPDAWETVAQFPGGAVSNWGASAIDGGRGVSPERWYASVYMSGVEYSRMIRSKIMRSDDDGVTWTVVYEADGGDPDHNNGRSVDSAATIAYDPQHPDDVYAVFSRFELAQGKSHQQHTFKGLAVKRSRDGGATWSELAVGDAPFDRWSVRLTVGVDSRYLYAATSKGVYRLALSE